MIFFKFKVSLKRNFNIFFENKRHERFYSVSFKINNCFQASTNTIPKMSLTSYFSDLNIPFPSEREADVVYQTLRVDAEPSRSDVTKILTLDSKTLKVNFSAKEARKIRVGLTSFFDSLLLVTETMKEFGPPGETYDHY